MIDTEQAAMRLARTIASDISLYNEEKIIRGIQSDTLFDELQDELQQGLNLYESRVDPNLLSQSNFFNRAVVDVIIKNKGHVKSPIW